MRCAIVNLSSAAEGNQRLLALAGPKVWRVARVGLIDRRIGKPPCARRCRRTEARKMKPEPRKPVQE